MVTVAGAAGAPPQTSGGNDAASARRASLALMRPGFVRSAEESGLASFDRLYATRAEAAATRTLAGGKSMLQALDFNASRATAMSPALADYRIVHFATH